MIDQVFFLIMNLLSDTKAMQELTFSKFKLVESVILVFEKLLGGEVPEKFKDADEE